MKYLVAGLGVAGGSALGRLQDLELADELVAWETGTTDDAKCRITYWRGEGVYVSTAADGLDALDRVGAGATVIKSPGLPADAGPLPAAADRGLEIIDELEFAWRTIDLPFIGITGTNGKSTTSHLISQALDYLDWYGNTEIGTAASGFNPESLEDWIVCEVSSFQLMFAPTFHPQIAVFTNLTPEHVPFHGSMEAYGAAKRSMFLSENGVCGHAVVNIDDPFGRTLAADCEQAGAQVTTYGFDQDADLCVLNTNWNAVSAETTLRVHGKPTNVKTRLPGRHNALNFAAAIGAAMATGMSAGSAAKELREVAPPPGRCEAIIEGQPFDVIVDYAHTGDGMEQILSTLLPAAHDRGGELRLVFGPVGVDERPRTEELAAAVLKYADHITLTPGSLGLGRRTERMAEMRELLGDAVSEMTLDRAKAIEISLRGANDSDVVVILGHGTLGRLLLDEHGSQLPHDDREVSRAVLKKMTFS